MSSVRFYQLAFLAVPDVSGGGLLVENELLPPRVFLQSVLERYLAVAGMSVVVFLGDESLASEHSSEESTRVEKQENVHSQQVEYPLDIVLNQLNADYDDVGVISI